MAEFASNGKGNLGVTLGAIGTGLSALGNNGILSGLFGNRYGMVPTNGGACESDHLVSRYEMDLMQANETLKSDLQREKSERYTDGVGIALYKELQGNLNEFKGVVNDRFTNIEGQLAVQAVYNATNTSTIGCLQNQVAALQGMTKTIIPYANICPEPMAKYNSWTAPTAGAAA